MTRFRYWLADLISGGELTFHKNGWDRSVAISQERASALSELIEVRQSQQDFRNMCLDYRSALTRIAAEAKPTSNATVMRMARMAQEALK